MCACEPGFVCSRCAGTSHDPAYFEQPDRDDERERAEREIEIAQLAEWFGSVFPR